MKKNGFVMELYSDVMRTPKRSIGLLAVCFLLICLPCVQMWPDRRCRLVKRGISPRDQEYILAEHNSLRQRVACGDERGQPPAAAMAQMRWDEGLAERAQRTADNCHMGSTGEDLGKNMLGIWWARNENGSSDIWKQAVEKWFAQSKHIEPKDLWSFKLSPATSYYTQLVWAASSDLGCGFSIFPNAGGYAKFFICFYRPRGNIPGQPVYIPGTPCSACYPRIPCFDEFPALCCANKSLLATSVGKMKETALQTDQAVT